jgi:hypothetical protein
MLRNVSKLSCKLSQSRHLWAIVSQPSTLHVSFYNRSFATGKPTNGGSDGKVPPTSQPPDNFYDEDVEAEKGKLK